MISNELSENILNTATACYYSFIVRYYGYLFSSYKEDLILEAYTYCLENISQISDNQNIIYKLCKRAMCRFYRRFARKNVISLDKVFLDDLEVADTIPDYSAEKPFSTYNILSNAIDKIMLSFKQKEQTILNEYFFGEVLASSLIDKYKLSSSSFVNLVYSFRLKLFNYLKSIGYTSVLNYQIKKIGGNFTSARPKTLIHAVPGGYEFFAISLIRNSDNCAEILKFINKSNLNKINLQDINFIQKKFFPNYNFLDLIKVVPKCMN